MSTDLAAPAAADPTSSEDEEQDPGVDHVTMRLGAGRYGVRAPDVAEVVHVPAVTRLPSSPGWLRGIGNWRGHVLPLVDLRSLLGLAVTPLPSSARVVVVAVDGVEVGLLAEAVIGLAPIRDDCPPAPPATGTELLRGLADGGAAGLVGVIDTAAVLALAERVPRSRRAGGSG